MADIDLKTLTPDTSLPTTGFLFGADSQATASPSVYGVTTAITTILGNAASSDALVFNSDTTFSRGAIRNFRFGAADAATALAQTLSVQSVVAATTDGAGANFTLTGSQSTGTGVPGNILIQTASSAATTGSAQNALATVATFGPSTLRLAQTTPALDLAQTWNTSGTPTALKLNVTNSASSANSVLMDLQVGGATALKVNKIGALIGAGAGSGNFAPVWINGSGSSEVSVSLGADGVNIIQSAAFAFTNSNGAPTGRDLFITRRAAAKIRFGMADTSASSTVTITIATPGVITWFDSELVTGTPVIFSTTGALPTGITAGTTYYVVKISIHTFQIATSLNNAIAATPVVVATSGTQSGTHTARRGAMAQTLSVQNASGTADFPGADLVITGSQGTGTGAGGSIIFQVAPAAGSTGSAQNALTDTLTLDSVGSVRVARALTVAGGVAALPGTPLAGMIARVSDALTPVIGATVAGGGAAYALVNYNGANWTVIGV